MQPIRTTAIALLVLLLCSLPWAHGQVNTRVITFNNAPFEEIVSRKAQWIPPRTEPGFLRITNGPGGIFLKPSSFGGLNKSFDFSTEIRFDDLAGSTFGIHFVPENSWTWQTLALRQDSVREGNSPGLSFSFYRSGSTLDFQLAENGAIQHTARIPAPASQTWLPLEITMGDFGRATVKLNGEAIADQVQLVFMPMRGRLLVSSDDTLELRNISMTLFEADGPQIQYVFATPKTISVVPKAGLWNINPANLLMKVDGSVVPDSAITLGAATIDYWHYGRFASASRHTIEVWYEIINWPSRVSYQRGTGAVAPYTVIPGDLTRLVSFEPQGIVTNLQPIRLVFSKPINFPPPAASDFTLDLNGVPTSFKFSETSSTVELTAMLTGLCPGEYNYNVRWREPSDNSFYQERIAFEYTGELSSARADSEGAVWTSLPEGEYYCYLRSSEASAEIAPTLKLRLATPGTDFVQLGTFSATNLTLKPLTDANGARTIIFLPRGQELRLENAPSGAVLEFQGLSEPCEKTLGLELSGNTIIIQRARGRLQFSMDLLDWEWAGPVFHPRFTNGPRNLFFRERN